MFFNQLRVSSTFYRPLIWQIARIKADEIPSEKFKNRDEIRLQRTITKVCKVARWSSSRFLTKKVLQSQKNTKKNFSGFEQLWVSCFGLRLVSGSKKKRLEPMGPLKFYEIYWSLIYPTFFWALNLPNHMMFLQVRKTAPSPPCTTDHLLFNFEHVN